MAHELGHHTLGHLWKFLALGSVAALAGFFLADYLLRLGVPHFGFGSLSDIANFPLLLLILIGFGLILLPLQNALSRMFEARSDRYALDKTQDPSAFISAMEKLARLSLADRSPNRFIEFVFHDHPPIKKRIKMAQKWQG
jgi:STE24 endopeptidase